MSLQTLDIRTLVNERPRDWRRGGSAPVLNPGVPWKINFDLLKAHRAIRAERLDTLPRQHLIWDIQKRVSGPSTANPGTFYRGQLKMINSGDPLPDYPDIPQNDANNAYSGRRETEQFDIGEEENVFLRKEFEAFERTPQTLSSARLTIIQGAVYAQAAPVLLQKIVSASDLSALNFAIKWSATTEGYEFQHLDSTFHNLGSGSVVDEDYGDDFYLPTLGTNWNISESPIFNEPAVRRERQTRIKDVNYSAEKVVPYRDAEGQISGQTADAYTSEFTFDVSASEANLRRGTQYMILEVSLASAPADYFPVSGGPVLIEQIGPTADPTGPAVGDDLYTSSATISDWP
jgi:hypothetical protein